MRKIRILALSGSLRKSSYNTALIEAISRLAPENVEVVVYRGMGELPLFNPDLEAVSVPPVAQLQAQLAASDGLIIASPEYAHGITGVLKNALDWLVGAEEFVHMPVALLNASPRATHAQAALREVVLTMSGCIVEPASIAVPLLGSDLTAEGIALHETISGSLTEALTAFCAAINAGAENTDLSGQPVEVPRE